MKELCIIVVLVCICLCVWSIFNAINTNKKNKAADEMSAKLFMADVEKDLKNKTERVIKADSVAKSTTPLARFETITPVKPVTKELNYDLYEEEEIPENIKNKSLKDFF